MREKDQMLHFRVSKAELDIIRQKMQEVGVRNMGAYLRKRFDLIWEELKGIHTRLASIE